MGKELAVGITFGATLGFAIGWLGLLRADFALAVAVAAAMVAVVLGPIYWASCFRSSSPSLGLSRRRQQLCARFGNEQPWLSSFLATPSSGSLYSFLSLPLPAKFRWQTPMHH